MSALMKLAGRGYGWYLPLKIGKALLALPLFLLYVPLLVVLALLLVVWSTGKALLTSPIWIIADSCAFWKRNWFSGFSRRYYNGLTHYMAPPVHVTRRKADGDA